MIKSKLAENEDHNYMCVFEQKKIKSCPCNKIGIQQNFGKFLSEAYAAHMLIVRKFSPQTVLIHVKFEYYGLIFHWLQTIFLKSKAFYMY